MYHNLGTPPPGARLRKLYVRPALFAGQMALLRLLGYRGVSMHEAMPCLQGEAPQEKIVAITFDDGYEDTLTLALPILKRYGHTATCYAVSQRIGEHNRWDADEIRAVKPLMTARQLQQWLAAGMEVGAHSRTHPHLPACSDSELEAEVLGCKAELEARLQCPVTQFCYPYGSFDPRAVEAVRRAGFVGATTTRRARARAGDDLFTLPRIMVGRHHLPHVLVLQLLTSYEDRRGG